MGKNPFVFYVPGPTPEDEEQTRQITDFMYRFGIFCMVGLIISFVLWGKTGDELGGSVAFFGYATWWFLFKVAFVWGEAFGWKVKLILSAAAIGLLIVTILCPLLGWWEPHHIVSPYLQWWKSGMEFPF